MSYLASAKALFVGLRVSTSFHQALQVADTKEVALKAARNEIRAAVRAAASRVKVEDDFWEPVFLQKVVRPRREMRPRFFTQGSVAYGLLVDPCQKPPQQLDLDDGLYVLVDFLAGQPALAAKGLFKLVEEALQPLCLRRGWQLDTSKATCVRVVIASDSHVDMPIYSAPRDVAESHVLEDAALAAGRIAKRAGQTYWKLPSDQIMLAHRDGTWIQSDPLQLQDWVDAAVRRYGEDFRRACRYFKAWRDHCWPRCCLSSITIMVAVQEALSDIGERHKGLDDDQLVYEIAQRLPALLAGELYNPVFRDELVVLNDWSTEQRAEIVGAAGALAEEMERALKRSTDGTLVVEALRRAFGPRMPFRPDMVDILPPATAAVVTSKPATVASPAIQRSISG